MTEMSRATVSAFEALRDRSVVDRNLANTAVLVLGMHRSGTSAVTGVLDRVGVELGPHLGSPLPDNPTGFFEHTDIVGVHEELFAALGTTWDDPRSLANGWHRNAAIAPFREKLATIVMRDFAASQLWGVKDPRLCRTLPLWLDVLTGLNVDAKVIIVGRDPDEVVASLRKRNFLDSEQSTMLWLSYVLSAERASRGLRRTVVLYDDLLADWEAEVERLHETLGVDFSVRSERVRDDVRAYLSTDLRHHRSGSRAEPRAPQNACAKTIFDSLVTFRRDGTPLEFACDRAAEALWRAERGAEPIVRYVQLKARADHDADLKAELDNSVEARRALQLQLIGETRSRAEDRRLAAEAEARQADSRREMERREIARADEKSELRREMEFRERARVHAEAELRAEIAAANEARRLLEAALAEHERLLRELQGSYSWRLTRPVRIGLTALRARLRGAKNG